jgi:hypothetical protein
MKNKKCQLSWRASPMKRDRRPIGAGVSGFARSGDLLIHEMGFAIGFVSLTNVD